MSLTVNMPSLWFYICYSDTMNVSGQGSVPQGVQWVLLLPVLMAWDPGSSQALTWGCSLGVHKGGRERPTLCSL